VPAFCAIAHEQDIAKVAAQAVKEIVRFAALVKAATGREVPLGRAIA
jgi:hypothetical protein